MSTPLIKEYTGILGRVKLLEDDEYCSVGSFRGQKVLVNNAQGLGEVKCLVRFSGELSKNEEYPLGNLVTRNIPLGFQTLGTFDYALLGHLNTENIPSYEQVVRNFNPGSVHSFLYFKQGFTNKKGKFIVLKNRNFGFNGSLRRAKDKLPSSSATSRMMIFQDMSDLLKVGEELRTKFDLEPILMEPLEYRPPIEIPLLEGSQETGQEEKAPQPYHEVMGFFPDERELKREAHRTRRKRAR